MIRVGLGYDIHPFGGDGPLVLGGVTIDGARARGHSDADAVAHAVADALLGPAGLPDLGTLFPASDEQYRGRVVARAAARRRRTGRATQGWSVGNVDVVISAERPALAPHLDAMASPNLDRACSAPTRHVSVKPKRGEGIGTVGRGEGIAVWAVALLERPTGCDVGSDPQRPERRRNPARVAATTRVHGADPRHAAARHGRARPRASRARCRSTCAGRRSTTSRTSATPAPRSCSTSSAATSSGRASTSRS